VVLFMDKISCTTTGQLVWNLNKVNHGPRRFTAVTGLLRRVRLCRSLQSLYPYFYLKRTSERWAKTTKSTSAPMPLLNPQGDSQLLSYRMVTINPFMTTSVHLKHLAISPVMIWYYELLGIVGGTAHKELVTISTSFGFW